MKPHTFRVFLTWDFYAALSKMVRLPNLLILACAQALVKYFLVGQGFDRDFWWLMCMTCLVAAAGYIVNDYYDVKIDIINKPDRVVVGKLISRRITLLINLTLNILACLIAVYLGWAVLLIVLLTISLLWWYSNFLKRVAFLGNLVVSFLTAFSIVMVPLYYQQGLRLVLVYASFAFFMNLIREILKDMEDVKGDRVFGCHTIPITIGIARTKYVIYLLLALFVMSLFLGFTFLDHNAVIYLAVVLVAPLAWIVVKVYRADTSQHFAVLSQLCKWVMVLGLGSIFWL